jgi:hypothetical protein
VNFAQLGRHAYHMSGKEIDAPRAARSEIKRHPVMVLFAASSAVALLAPMLSRAGRHQAILTLLVLLVAGAPS